MTKKRDVADLLADGGDLRGVIDEALRSPPSTSRAVGAIFVTANATFEQTKAGPIQLLPFVLRFEENVQRPEGHLVRGVVTGSGMAPTPFEFPAALLGDARQLNRQLAAMLGTRFRDPAGKLRAVVEAWLAASTPRDLVYSHDFGFTDRGDQFVMQAGSFPNSGVRFGPPLGSSAHHLGLPEPNPSRALAVAADLMNLWPTVTKDGPLVRALLGIVAWSVVCPVLEARSTVVSPVLPFLLGRSGTGKSTHAGLVQSFFGDFGARKSAISFGSTALAVEEEAYWYRGCTMVVGDVKVSILGEGGAAKWLGLLQRAADRGHRRRMDVSGAGLGGRPSRTTLFFEGEDLPTQEASALARLLVLKIPEAARDTAAMLRLEDLRSGLPLLTRSLADALLAQAPWDQLLSAYHREVERCTTRLGTSTNGVRLARSIAAVLVGCNVWTSVLGPSGIELPSTAAALSDVLIEQGRAAIDEVEAGSPAESFLELVDQALSMGVAWLVSEASGTRQSKGDCIGREEAGVQYLMPEVALSVLRHHLPEAASRLKPAASIAEDLARLGLLHEVDRGRRTKKKRVLYGGGPVSTWAIHRTPEDCG